MGAIAKKPYIMPALSQYAEVAARLKVDNVSLRYQSPAGDTFTALERVSFEVPDQQFAVIVGPSGCGKSSLLYLTAGLNEPTEGDIYVGGRKVDGPGADRGMVFQGYTLFPWLTVRQNIEFGLKRRGLPATEMRTIVEFYLQEVGLDKFAEHFPKQLSGGMMQRVAIARALANDPQILLMDEPFGALDSQTRLQMQQLLLQVWGNSKKTVVFVTHDIDEAILLADRIYVMGARPGRIKEILDVPIERPRNLDVVMEPEFIRMKRHILGLLHDDMEEVH
ncbi:Bicarbonate transport ATP-binding protein CmpD [Pseudomonas sp. THAF187a]|jgi:NitT/TauT family transport system ATP-binding protein|uniref:Taurine transporter subunit ATP-binding component of ABC superfamily n=2 Tax=Ectopseudomonas TaxID=3236654 RepID=A0A653B316_ECTOL|nr:MULTISPECIES: ABC transporter ATP-binding protein [Pseudomonas]TNF14580.1 MAG: ABC transporter ATP-binding protein [Pseudomonadales bacterium]CAE6962391.1 Taurine transporter subunit ATP-binding component of ABC superfamily [Pseudomonas oleovorans]QFT24436.1 Bicarbonate transport ATP-binding protein CmpD [Pseudomonas sp. THAF187a]QFT44623.1 Bicarbonate transport ATP-binding protein CmpD [Pseudomonas sp. THAF42]QTS86281.1 ABC transporter ATP-binding protein [Pseudomonas khazarica]|tara:strand:- start:1142 stop:1975 length:834 start_codon:yes stop_codon:yes gene_type:complete